MDKSDILHSPQITNEHICYINGVIRREWWWTRAIASPEKAILLALIRSYLRRNGLDEDTIKDIIKRLHYQIGWYNGEKKTFDHFSYDPSYKIDNHIPWLISDIL